MKRAAEKQAYEAAALARDRLAAISKVMAGQQAVDDRAGDIDAIGVAREGRQGAGYVLNVRSGRIVGHNEFPFAPQGQETEAELAGEFVREYYARAVDLPDGGPACRPKSPSPIWWPLRSARGWAAR